MRPSMDFIKSTFGNKFLMGMELGVREGEHALTMLEKLYLVDIWDKYICEGKTYDYTYLYEIVRNKFNRFDNIEIIKGTFLQIANKIDNLSLDFIYIDANHQYEYVRQDIENWYYKIKLDGWICGHDYTPLCPGVIRAVNEFVKLNNSKLHINDTDWWFKKEE